MSEYRKVIQWLCENNLVYRALTDLLEYAWSDAEKQKSICADQKARLAAIKKINAAQKRPVEGIDSLTEGA